MPRLDLLQLDTVTRRYAYGEVADVMESRTFSCHDDTSEERVIRVDVGASLDRRNHRNVDVCNVL
jgi:hypothetical protein